MLMLSLRSIILLMTLTIGLAGIAQQSDSDRLKKEQQELQKKIGLTKKLLETLNKR